MINEMGGVNGRSINLISLDDGYNPSKTVEQVRRLVEQEQVAFIFNSMGTSPNLAVQPYLNDNKVPQIFLSSGASRFGDPRHFPWTIRAYPSFQTEAHVYAKHILATKPDARIGVLYQNDAVGKEYLTGLRDGLGVDRAGMIVKEVSTSRRSHCRFANHRATGGRTRHDLSGLPCKGHGASHSKDL